MADDVIDTPPIPSTSNSSKRCIMTALSSFKTMARKKDLLKYKYRSKVQKGQILIGFWLNSIRHIFWQTIRPCFIFNYNRGNGAFSCESSQVNFNVK